MNARNAWPVLVTPSLYLLSEEQRNFLMKVSLYQQEHSCEVCKEVSLKCSIIKNHIGSSKHIKMMEGMKNRKGKDADI